MNVGRLDNVGDKVVQGGQAEGGELGFDRFDRRGWNGLTGSGVDLDDLARVDDLVGLVGQKVCKGQQVSPMKASGRMRVVASTYRSIHARPLFE